MKLGSMAFQLGLILWSAATITPLRADPVVACSCPQTNGGWLLFADSSLRTPDFWWQEEVVVQEIAACAHGVRFVFVANDRENSYLTALVFTDPPSRIRNGNRIPPSGPRAAMALLRSQIAQVLDSDLEAEGRMDFRYLPMDERPRIVRPWRRLALVWQGRELELRGYLDVYMTFLL